MVNSLSDERTTLLFAGDTTLLSWGDCAKQGREVADQDFEKSKLWFAENKFLVNDNKIQNCGRRLWQ